MKIERPVLVFLATLAAVTITAIPAPAQHMGFQIAIAPPVIQPIVNQPIIIPGFVQPVIVLLPGQATFGFPPTQAPPIVTRAPLPHAFHQAFHQGNTVVVVQQPCCWQQTYPFTQGQIITPGQVIVPGQVIIPGQVFTPGAVITNVPVAPQAFFGPPVQPAVPVVPVVPVGTPRAQVIAQLGRPSVTVVTSTGETLYFNGGVTVIIQNGQVITGPR